MGTVMESASEDLALPAALREVADVGFECGWDEEADKLFGCDFEPYEEFETTEETTSWLQDWTGNDEIDGKNFRFFGSTGSGDYVGFWLVRSDVEVSGQPVVYFGSEGEKGVIARDLGDLLWIYADGKGPADAFDDPGRETQQNEAFQAIAERYAEGGRQSTAEIVSAAQKEFPGFSELIDSLCR